MFWVLWIWLAIGIIFTIWLLKDDKDSTYTAGMLLVFVLIWPMGMCL